jgi:CRP-like cAMP-binding protein
MKALKVECENCENKNKSIFCDLNQGELAEVSVHKITNVYKKGQTLFHEGNPAFGLFCINSGKIKLTKSSPDGKDSIVRLIGPGDVLGHRSLFDEGNAQGTATALEESTICFLDKKYITKIIKEKPHLASQVITHLSKEMGAAEDKIASYFQKNVRERLAEFLFEMKEKFGTIESGRTRLEIKLTREEMASIVGVATETLIRFMSEFKQEGAIEQEGKVIFILDENKLKELGNID